MIIETVEFIMGDPTAKQPCTINAAFISEVRIGYMCTQIRMCNDDRFRMLEIGYDEVLAAMKQAAGQVQA
jgi:hypothetical protein